MGLTLKSFQDVLKGMADWVTQQSNKLVDFTTGSMIRTLLEAVATEVEEFYYRTYKNFQWSVENSIYNSFNFQPQPAVKANGSLTLTFSNALTSTLTIPIGTQFATTGQNPLYFQTTSAYTISVGATTASITVYCTTPGTIGNVGANTITVMTNPISVVSTVTNPSAFLTGMDEETPAQRKARFANYVNTRARGTKRALEYGTLEVSGVAGVYVDDSQLGVVTVYAYDSAGNLSSTLQTSIQNNLENYRTAGIPVLVTPIVKLTTDVSVTLTVTSLYNTTSFIQYVQTQITNYLNAFSASDPLYLSNLNAFIRGLDTTGILNVQITTPTADIITAKYQLIRAGNVTVTAQSA